VANTLQAPDCSGWCETLAVKDWQPDQPMDTTDGSTSTGPPPLMMLTS
jgi:hypothetical protein